MSNSYHLWIVFVIMAISNCPREHVALFSAVAIVCMTAIMLQDRQCRLEEHRLTVGQQLEAPRPDAREQVEEESAPVKEEPPEEIKIEDDEDVTAVEEEQEEEEEDEDRDPNDYAPPISNFRYRWH